MNRDPDSDAGSPDLDEVLADYMRRVDRGETIDNQSLIAAHPDLAAELREYFSQAKAIDRFAASATADFTNQATLRGALEVRCPSCHAPMEVAVDTALTDLTCSVCGSNFSLVDQSKATCTAPSLSKLGRFELIERLGVGGFGSVWKARDKELDRTVAIKVPLQSAMAPEQQENFFREARAAAQLRHPNIVSVLEVGRDGDSIFIVSDFVCGVTLGDWLAGQQLTCHEAAELCAKIADALHHAHEQGVVHRDLKPANVMMNYDGQPHLTDFGLARRESGEITVTIDGQVLGTPAYMSPEQAQGEGHTADRRSDVYSLGVILFQLLTGELPFRGNARMLIKQVIQDEPPSPRKLNSAVPRDLETITLKCLEKQVGQRYRTAQHVADELRRWLAGQPIHARPIGRFEQAWRWAKRNPRLTSLTASVAALLIAVAALSTLNYASIRRQKIEAELATEREAALRQQARMTVDNYFTKVSQTNLLDAAGLQPLRKELLELALNYYQDLVAKGADDPETLSDLAAAHFRVGVINNLLGDNAQAVESLQQAVQIWENLVEQEIDIPDLNADLANAYVNLATLRGESQEVTASLDLCVKARQLWRKLLFENPADQNYRLCLAQTEDQHAGLQLQMRQFEEALRTYEEASAHYKLLVDKVPGTLAVQRQFAVHLRNKALAYTRLRRHEDARDALVEASLILKSCLTSSPSDLSSLRFLATVYSHLGQLYADEKQPEEALRLFTLAQEVQSALALQNPDVADIQLEYAQTLIHLIGIKLDQPTTGQPQPETIAVKRILRELTSTSPKQTTTMRRSLADLFLRLATHELRCGDVNQAVSSHAEGMRLCSSLLDTSQDREILLQSMAEDQEGFAAMLRDARNFDAAESHFRHAVHIRSQQLGKTSRIVGLNLAQMALVQAAAHNFAGYRQTCKTLVEEFGGSDEPKLINLIAWTCSLRSESSQDPSRIVELAEKAVAAEPRNRAFLNTLGLALFRAGENDKALQKLHMAIDASTTGPDAIDRLIIAMIYFRTNRHEDGLAILHAVQDELNEPSVSDDSRRSAVHAEHEIDIIERELFLSEAKQLSGNSDSSL